MKIKVLQVVGSLDIGGAETVAVNLYRYINKEKYEFHYLVYGLRVGAYEEEIIKSGGKVIHMDYSAKHPIRFKKEFSDIMKKYGPYKVVHTHLMFHNGIVLKLAAERNVEVRISHSHSTKDRISSGKLGNEIFRKIYRERAGRCIKKYGNLFLACGGDAGSYLYGKNFFINHGYLVRNGIDLDKFAFCEHLRNEIREKFNITDNRVYACIGHLSPVKNHRFAISVFEEIVKLDKKAILFILGDGALRKELEELCEEIGVADKVLFKGNVDNIYEWMQAIDFLLMPSLFEGLPVTLVEAQAAGVKCFVSDQISKEANITGTLHFIALTKKESWVEIAKADVNDDRSESICKMRKLGYDVKESVEFIEQLYDRNLNKE